uniref:Dimethylaniline monooxygenase, N-oxide-forming n=1 Tax=Tanacetum cinerariifolium TaxID=118510 RepID=A0A699K983_TANCI|nr:dimethylaniline monooxygenase, N-oxide-forming [Tanacetum cinerariifolium]
MWKLIYSHQLCGSIDGKVCIWDVHSCHVTDWIDLGDIVSAVCYNPDGKGSIVGTLDGKCSFYDITVTLYKPTEKRGHDNKLSSKRNIMEKKQITIIGAKVDDLLTCKYYLSKEDLPTQQETIDYIHSYVKHFQLMPHINFRSRVKGISYDEPSSDSWVIWNGTGDLFPPQSKWNITIKNTKTATTHV